MAKNKVLGFAMLAWMGLAAAHAGQARFTGKFAQFQHCPYNDPEVDSPLETTVIARVRRELEKLFLGLTCYVGSIVQAARRIITLNNPSRTDHRQSRFFGSSQPAAERLTVGNEQLGAEPTTTGTHALRTLTFSPA